jgi:hypothetical protein
MSRSAMSDLLGLASLAREPGLDLRRVLLRVQADLFVTAPSHNRSTIAAFEALLCGLLPAVDDETAAFLARKLAPIADAPEGVLSALAARGGAARSAVIELASQVPTSILQSALAEGVDLAPMLAARPGLSESSIRDLVGCADEASDIALARNLTLELPANMMDVLLARARTRPDLAAALLARHEPSPADSAALYLWADDVARERIREGVANLVALRHPADAAGRADPDACQDLVAFAQAGDEASFGQGLATMLGLETVPDWGFQRAERHDLLGLALSAAGVAEEEAIVIFLTLHEEIARSVAVVFRLAHILRTITRPTAAYLVEAVLGAPVRLRPAGRPVPAADPSGTPSRSSATVVRAGVERRPLQERVIRSS